MRSRLWLVVLLSLAACGEPSTVDPDARVSVEGRVQRVDGSPVADATVVVTKEIGPAELAADAPLFFGTAGFVCLTPVELDVCEESGTRASASAGGTFEIELRGRDVQSGFGTVSTLLATAAAPTDVRTPAATTQAFTATSEHIALPALTLWEPDVTVEAGKAGVLVDWPALPPKLGRAPDYRAHFQTDTGAPVWTVEGRRTPVDGRVLEDFRGSVAVEAHVDGGTGDIDGPTVYRSQGQEFAGVHGAPPSRGAGCTAVATKRRAVTYDPCPLTDGVLDVDFDPALDPTCPKGKDCPHWDTAVVVDLGEQREVSLVVVRADADRFVLSASTDGRRWRRIATAAVKGGQAKVTPKNSTRARYIRLAAERWPLPTLRELSVW